MLSAAPAYAGTVAITVDDLPIYATDFPSLATARAITTGLLEGFRRNGWKVTGFVIGGELAEGRRAERAKLLLAWLDAGQKLGDHGFAHDSLTRTVPGTYVADLALGDRATRAVMSTRGRTPHWFRYPYLETGASPIARHVVETWLALRGLRVAPVSMENTDWLFAEPYDEALAHGEVARAATIRAAYLTHTAAMVGWYRRAALRLLGREPAFVFLLHASRLNSASIDALAAILDANDLRPVSLDAAVADPAYAIPDTYVGPKGYPSEQRWALALGKPLSETDLPQVPADITAAYARIEAADPDPGTSPVKARP